MSDPFRDDQEAQLARANALAIENEQLKRERDELKAKLSGLPSSTVVNSTTKSEQDLSYMRKRLAGQQSVQAEMTVNGPQVRTTRTAITFYIPRGPLASTVTLDGPRIKIGRVPSADLRLEDSSVARMHAIVEINAPALVVVVDLGSPTGTLVNGTRINKAQLMPGDVLRIGNVEMRIDIQRSLVTP